MNQHFPVTLLALAIVGAVISSLTAGPALAQSALSPAPAVCAATANRAAGLRSVPAKKSLQDLSLAIAGHQANLLHLAHVALLDGACADDVYAFRMTQIAFHDGAVFSADHKGQFSYSPHQRGLGHYTDAPVFNEYPTVRGAEFIMAAKVDSDSVERSVDVGLWKTSADYLVAAYTRQEGGVSDAVELVRSTMPIKSVTFFRFLILAAAHWGCF
jgi:hypothetical protein